MLVRVRQWSAEHETILQRVLQGVPEIGASHLGQIGLGVAGSGTVFEIAGEGSEGSTDDLGQNMIAAREVLVGSLMRDPDAAGDFAQAQSFQAGRFNDRQRFLDTRFAQVFDFCFSRHRPGAGSSLA